MKRFLAVALGLAVLAALGLVRCGAGAPDRLSRVERDAGGQGVDSRASDLAAPRSARDDARAPASAANEEPRAAEAAPRVGRIVLRTGPRPQGVSTVLGRFVKPQRVDDEDLPEWYRPHPGLAVSLSRGGGGGTGEARRFDGSAENASEPLEIVWEGVDDGVYRIGVELRGDAGSATTELTGIVVDAEGIGTDPRVGLWDPMLDFDVMELSLQWEDEWADEPEFFVVAVAEGATGRAFVCPPKRGEGAGDEAPYGPYLLAHGRGRSATVYAFEETGGEAAIPFRAGRVTVELPEQIPTAVQAERVVGAPDLNGRTLHLRRVAPDGQWLPSIHPQRTGSSTLVSGDSYVPIGVPAPADYVWTTEDGDWTSEPLRIERVEEPELFRLPLAPVR